MKTTSKLMLRILIFSTILTAFAYSCTFQSLMKDNDKEIPTTLGKNKTTILVIKHNEKSYNKYLEKNWSTYYTGEYIIIDSSKVAEYTDKEKYRYIFNNETSNNYYSNPDNNTHKNLQGISFLLLDRQTDKVYISNIESGFWSKLMIAYIKKMNQIRAKNGDK